MAIYRGRDATVAVGGVTVVGTRDATITTSTQTIQIQPFGQRAVGSYSLSESVAVSFDTIDDAAVTSLLLAATTGASVTVTVTGYTQFSAIVAGVTDAQPLDGVRAWTVTLERTVAAWRS